MKKIVALLLGLTMSMSCLAGCGSNEEQQESSQSASQTEPSESVQEQQEEKPEPITLTWAVNRDMFVHGDGIHTDKSAALQYIEEQTGITIDWYTYDADKYNLWCSGGDLPDIVSLWSSYDFNDLFSSGQIVELSDLVAEYGQTIAANIPSALNQMEQMYGGLYCLPIACNQWSGTPNNGTMGYRYRYDIYEAIGSPEITDEDSLLEVAKQMQDYAREQSGNENIYVYSTYKDHFGWMTRVAYPFSRGYANISETWGYNVSTGEVVNEYIDEDSPFWQGVEFFNKAWNMGLVDPEAFTQDSSQYVAKVANGTVLACYNGNGPDTSICGEKAYMAHLEGAQDGYVWIQGSMAPTGYGATSARAISTNCEYPERAMQLLEFLEQPDTIRTMLNGPKGVTWDYVDGVPTFTDEILQMYKDETANEYLKQYTMAHEPWSVGYLYSGSMAASDGQPLYCSATKEFMAEFATANEKDFAEDYGCSYPGEVYWSWIEEHDYVVDDNIDAVMAVALSVWENFFANDLVTVEAEAVLWGNAHTAELYFAETAEEFDTLKAEFIAKIKEIGITEEADTLFKEDFARGMAEWEKIK